MYGLICTDDIGVVGHSLFNNFRLALYNYLGKENFKEIKSLDDLSEPTHLFIVDEHYAPNKAIWMNDAFIESVNRQGVKVIVFNFEKIYNSAFPWNVDIQKNVERFENVFQLVSDADDAALLKKGLVNQQFLSKDTNLKTEPKLDKVNRILFIGQLAGPQYESRRDLLTRLNSDGFTIDVVATNRRFSYGEFLSHINYYKYVLNPLGTGKFINLRYHEIIRLGGIPLQQIAPAMHKWCNFMKKNGIFFTDSVSLSAGFDTYTEPKVNEITLEDYFTVIGLKGYL